MHSVRIALVSLAAAALLVAGCGETTPEQREANRIEDRRKAAEETGLDPRPERLDGSRSDEFEGDDLRRAGEASQAVQDYCSGAVSEAQRLGCLSHVDESDLP